MTADTLAQHHAHGLLAGIGHTPLVEIDLVRQVASDTRLFAKLEGVNPGGSVKDRPVARMLVQAIAAGRFAGGKRLLDSSSGNAGISYAMLGAALRLREVRPDVYVAAAIPETFPGIEGLKPLGHPGDIVPALLDQSLIDERIAVSLEEAVAMCRRLASRGLFVGPSSGAFIHVALKLAASGKYRTMVTLLSDAGERYGST